MTPKTVTFFGMSWHFPGTQSELDIFRASQDWGVSGFMGSCADSLVVTVAWENSYDWTDGIAIRVASRIRATDQYLLSLTANAPT
jgi:hypothetical protein